MTQTAPTPRVQAGPSTVFRATMPIDGGGVLEWHCRSYTPTIWPSEVRFQNVPLHAKRKWQAMHRRGGERCVS